METNKKLFSNNLKYLMALNNKTRSDLSKELKISYTTICDWVNGNAVPRPSKQDKIAELLGVSVSRLFEEPKESLLNTDLRNSLLLMEYINNLAKNDVERELLNNCILINTEHQKIINEQVNYYINKENEENSKN